MTGLDIVSIEGIGCSVPFTRPSPQGVGTVVKKEAVVVRVETSNGIVGYGEAHHARAPQAIAELINTTMRDLVLGMDASETVRIWQHVYRNQLATHGTGAAGSCALSGIDVALWDIRAKSLGIPLYQLLGGHARPMPAYAGGISLGYQPPQELVAEVGEYVDAGFTAVKLRLGDSVARDVERVRAVREAFNDLVILTDANTSYTLREARSVVAELWHLGVDWLEEPFAPDNRHAYHALSEVSQVPLAAGENHYTKFEFDRLIEDNVVDFLQPDVAKCGGITEVARVGAMASARHIPICPHTSSTGISMAATIHLLSALPTGFYFEADVARENKLRTELGSLPYSIDADGNVRPLERPGIGVDVDEDFLRAHPLTPGFAFIPNRIGTRTG